MTRSLLRQRVAIAAALLVTAATAAPEAHGVAKVGLGVAASVKAPAPNDANMWVGVVGSKPKGKLAAAAAPKVRVKSGRPKGVVVIYGLKRLTDGTRRYRLVVFAIRGAEQAETSKAAKGTDVAIETIERSGGKRIQMVRTDAVNSVVGSNRKPKHKMLDLEGFTFGTAGGQLAPDPRSAESKARHDIALNAFLARYAYRQAFDLSGDPDDDEFLRVLESCCQNR